MKKQTPPLSLSADEWWNCSDLCRAQWVKSYLKFDVGGPGASQWFRKFFFCAKSSQPQNTLQVILFFIAVAEHYAHGEGSSVVNIGFCAGQVF